MMPKYLRNLTIAWLAYSALTLIVGAIAYPILSALDNDKRANEMLIMSIFGALGLICVFGLAKRKAWGWAGTVALAIVNMANIPIGTILGLTTFWVLFKKEVRDFFWVKR